MVLQCRHICGFLDDTRKLHLKSQSSKSRLLPNCQVYKKDGINSEPGSAEQAGIYMTAKQLWKGTGGVQFSSSSIRANSVQLLWQRKATECWSASTTASPAEIKKPFFASTQCLSCYTCISVFRIGPCQAKMCWLAGDGSENVTKMIQGLRSCHMRTG